MKVTKESTESFTVEFESDEELRHEFETNLSAGGLFLSSTERPAEMSTIHPIRRYAQLLSITPANPRTPTPLALKLLPTLPELEIRHIAKSTGVSQALKQAALRIVISRG